MPESIIISPIARVSNSRLTPSDDYWGNVITEITLEAHIPDEAFLHLTDFSHLEIIYYFDKVQECDIVYAGHPRGNTLYPKVGIFGQRKKDRPNSIGLTTVELIELKGRTIVVKGLDAIDGTPVIDIKPVFRQFEPQQEIRQPDWVDDLMKNYYLP